jgi:hypothetical protein
MTDLVGKQSSVDDELREAYRSTHFNVLEPAPFTLRIEEQSQDLADLYRDYDVCSAAFLTAWNPFSEPIPQQENDRAQRQLERQLHMLAVAALSGIGEDASGQWPGEPSVLALGISRETAISLGNEYRQNAIVWIGADRIPELVFLQ